MFGVIFNHLKETRGPRAFYHSPDNKQQTVQLTRAPRGTDRSPEYKEHFCYKLDSRVKNLTTEWNQKQKHFITHASRSLL